MVTLAAVYSLTGGIIPATLAMFGSVLPDVLELRRNGQVDGLIRHRTITHYPPLWLGVGFLLWLFYRSGGYSSWSLYAGIFFVAGGLMHLAEDALSKSGIPFSKPYGKAHGAGLYIVNTVGEELTAACLLLAFSAVAYARGYFGAGHTADQMALFINLCKGFLTHP